MIFKGATIRILRLGRVGLPAALDKGLQATECEYIARLDCDDLCEEGRLRSQRDYLERHREVHVVGGQAVVIAEEPVKGASSSGCRVVRECGVLAGNYPTAPLLVQWAMYFRCSVLHPSVMFRKSVIVQCGSYSNTRTVSGSSADTSCEHLIEDYSLWMRVLHR
jgi:Glycosyl transferase family 2